MNTETISQTARIFVGANHSDAERFASDLLSPDDLRIYAEDIRSWAGVRKVLRDGAGTMILIGLRPPDWAGLLYLGQRCRAVAVLQHAKQPRRSISELPPGFFIQNLHKLFYWAAFSAYCKLMSFLSRTSRGDRIVRLYHFSDDYTKELERFLTSGTYEAIACPLPDPTRFGTSVDIPISQDPVAFHLIDEPFTTTLGLSAAKERELLQAILDAAAPDRIHVKVHPRSTHNKFSFSDRFIISEAIYAKARTLIGYRSGLLDYPFQSPMRLIIGFEGGTISLSPIANPIVQNETTESYIDVVQRDLAAHGL